MHPLNWSTFRWLHLWNNKIPYAYSHIVFLWQCYQYRPFLSVAITDSSPSVNHVHNFRLIERLCVIQVVIVILYVQNKPGQHSHSEEKDKYISIGMLYLRAHVATQTEMINKWEIPKVVHFLI